MITESPTVNDDRMLAVPGIKVDNILTVSSAIGGLTKESFLNPVMECIEFLCGCRGSMTPYLSGYSLKDAVWRTLTIYTSREEDLDF